MADEKDPQSPAEPEEKAKKPATKRAAAPKAPKAPKAETADKPKKSAKAQTADAPPKAKPAAKAPKKPKAETTAPAESTAPAAPPKTQLLTGFPGFIGRRLVRRLLEGDPKTRLVLLVEPRMLDAARAALSRLEGDVPSARDRVELVAGDITLPALGMDPSAHTRLLATVNVVWHLAAIYDLAVSEELAYRVNVLGTSNVLDFCQAARAFARLNYISTCYVAGDRTGPVLESELDAGQGHKNHYESTKFWAELEVQRRMASVPTAIFRPAIVVGDSRTGETEKLDGPYFFIKLLVRGPAWLPMVHVGPSEAQVNIVPVDFVVEAMATIAEREDATGKVFQLADPNPMRARDLTEAVLIALGRRTPLATVPAKPVVAALGLEPVRRLVGIPPEAVLYWNHPVAFDCRNTLEALADSGVRCPHVSSYLRTMIDFVRQATTK